MSLRIGTRGSALALAQARQVADALGGGELVEIATAGDRGAPGGDKSRWVAELERALLDAEVDIAVHSAKDVPGELAAGLAIAAVPARADARDVLVGAASLDALAPGARVGTSSLRRAAQLRAAREDLEIVSMRGNVDTRLRRQAEGEWDAIVLARAGLERLGRASEAGGALDPAVFVPAPGQGALAVETRVGDEARVAGLDDPESHARLRAERALTVALGASCHTPVGAYAEALDGGFALTGFAGLPDGSLWVRDRLEGSDPEALGRAVAERMLAAGAGEILRQAEAAA
ncbi:MAG: hydroxymethylbilane synthase [Solirubrobacteraceae bacterium]|nr:hydroxymethylbilane synthase [Solirubrobacteraceae bacterium]